MAANPFLSNQVKATPKLQGTMQCDNQSKYIQKFEFCFFWEILGYMLIKQTKLKFIMESYINLYHCFFL